MTEAHRPRPMLATLICIFEVAIVFLALMGLAFAQVVRSANPSLATVQTSPMRMAISWLAYLLSIGIAVTLWQMRRESFYLAAAKLGLSLLGIFVQFMHPARIAHVSRVTVHARANTQAIGAIAVLFIVISLSISAAITFYIYDVTQPRYGSVR
jgi:hypothetical protein